MVESSSFNQEANQNSITKINSEKIGKQNLVLQMFGGLFQKDIEVSVLPASKVMIGGDAVGIRLYSKGVLIIGEAPVQGLDGNWYEPYKNTHIKKGDKIMKINGEKVETILEVMQALSYVQEVANIEYEQNGKLICECIYPAKSLEDGENKLGLWVRDGAIGVGTLTFYDPSNGSFCALGHGISDVDIKELIDVDVGYLNLATVASVTKGQKGFPGEMKGILEEDGQIGNITLNKEDGIYGKYEEGSNLFLDRPEVTVASKQEIQIGPAKMYCTVEEYGKPKAYDIKVNRVLNRNDKESKGMIIEVTDVELLEKTGGIIQGMSGSPIIQNNKLIGAVTHVYVNPPTKGYAILAESMMNEMSQF